MSGGSLDYLYHKIESSIPSKDYFDTVAYNYLTTEEKDYLRKSIKRLEEAVIIAKRLEWFMSDDDGIESFKSRLREELGYDLLYECD